MTLILHGRRFSLALEKRNPANGSRVMTRIPRGGQCVTRLAFTDRREGVLDKNRRDLDAIIKELRRLRDAIAKTDPG